MRWQVRAQNAADAAAGASLAPIADGWNEIESEEYAGAIEEMQHHYHNQAIPSALDGRDCTTANRTADYNVLETQLNTAMNNYDQTANFLSNVGSTIDDRFGHPSNGAFETIAGGVHAGFGWTTTRLATSFRAAAVTTIIGETGTALARSPRPADRTLAGAASAASAKRTRRST